MAEASTKARLTLVGAGPGDPELISLKAVKALQQADAILYDALAAPELLGYAKKGCKLINVGKRKGKMSASQDDINKLIVTCAYQYNSVVRLKGGDPFVFGRGHEEWEYAAQHGIEVEYIPGISSSIAAPASVGIPLTKRGVNQSFWVITGTLASGEISADLKLAAQSSATVIVLMGMTHLSTIASMFGAARSGEEPIAVIQNATMKNQKFVRGSAATIVELAQKHHLETPAVIVIGKVVEESLVIDYIQRQKLLAA
jgi:uroporphyrin-III C-methyltransferase